MRSDNQGNAAIENDQSRAGNEEHAVNWMRMQAIYDLAQERTEAGWRGSLILAGVTTR